MFALFLYLTSGLLLACLLLPDRRIAVRFWLGLDFGCVLLMWLPCLFAFAFGFTRKAQYAALVLAGVISLCSLFLLFKRKRGFRINRVSLRGPSAYSAPPP